MANKDISSLKWGKFDSDWYCKRYSSILPMINDIYGGDVYLYYQEKGRKIGHSPNPFFDEKWYLSTYPNVAQLIQDKKFKSGFEHYCQEGFKEYSPHWLFSENYYQECYSKQTDNFAGYLNGYDHYLNVGDLLSYTGSLYFNPRLYLLQQTNLDEINAFGGPYQFFLKTLLGYKNTIRVSWFFDEQWYLETYSEVSVLLEKRLFLSGLHHYLANNTPAAFSPLSDFSEEFYDQHYADVSSAIGLGNTLRSGYAHFILYGLNEGRKSNETLDLDQYKLQDDVVKALSSGLFHNVFEYWVAQKQQELFKEYYILNIQDHQKETIDMITSPSDRTEFVEKKIEIEGGSDEKKPNDEDTSLEEKDLTLEDADLNEDNFSVLTVNADQSLFAIQEPVEKITFVEFSNEKKEMENLNVKEDVITEEDSKKVVLNAGNMVAWKLFDKEWYVRRYSNATAKMKALELDDIEEYYYAFGCYEGESPNPYFDEQWYINTYPEVKELIQQHQYTSGFDHYCRQGHLVNSPHWLFSESFYREANPHLTNDLLLKHGFINGYDHYLRVGDQEGLSGSLFFDPNFFIGHYNNPISPALGAYSYYLKHMDIIEEHTRTSWYFDPEWYLSQYLDVLALIKDNKFINPLHHYLTNDDPSKYSPSCWFDEEFYTSEYATLIEEESYRNGYDHFLKKGIGLLLCPLPSINLGNYSFHQDVKKDIGNGLYPNIYVHWLAKHHDIKDIEDLPEYTEEEYKFVSDIAEDSQHYQGAVWAQFDEAWYLTIYPDSLEKMKVCGFESVYEYYKQIGAFLGQSPNAYFDEEWYLYHHESVRKAIKRGKFKTGFEHYCKVGFEKNQPHWLFLPNYYLYLNPEFVYEINSSSEYVNAYDHYLKKGDALRKTGSLFFDPLVYERYCYESGDVDKTYFPYRNYLLNISRADRKASVSLYFDTRWYLEKYPEVLKKIKSKDITSALQHYFMNSTPTLYDPLPWFSEAFYVDTYQDLSGAILKDGSGAFRNGYEHFITHGCLECRNPQKNIDLREYFLSGSIRDDIENGFYRDAFAHWVFDKRLEVWINNLPEDSHYRLDDQTISSREYFRKKAHFMLPTVAHEKLDFSYEGKPDISVVMLVKNQLAVTLTALSSLRANFNGKIQLLIGDNYSTDDTRFIQNSLTGVNVTRFAYNFGYGRACNYLIEQVQAPVTVFLNNDIYLYPGAIEILCKHLMSSADIGAVGGKIIHPNGNLQEAGSIIWRDGTTAGYLRGESPTIAEANFIRDVDFCSTAMMAMKTILLQQLKGFSSIYYPAYFEDTDLCVRIIKAGFRVVYHPDAVVEHMEYASSDPIVSSGLIRRNHRLFVQAHKDFLKFQQPRHSDNIPVARQRVGKGKRVLFIEDRVPLRRLGSGYVRSNDVIHQMAHLGYQVTVYPINGNYPHLYQIYSDFPATVEILYNKTIDHIRDFFFERAGYYDIVWIGRTHNLHRILPMMGEANRYLPQDSLILDTEVIAAPRTQLRNKILGIINDDTLDNALEIELSCARHCHMMVAVNEIDANYAKKIGFDQVEILGHMMRLRATPKTWDQRKNLLFIGALHDDLSPNFDSLQWFVGAVLPILIETMGDSFNLTIAGYVHPSVDMSVFAKYSQVQLLGPVEDLTHLYNNHRVYIAPTRFAGGIPYKLHEAASFGIPIVAAELLVNQLGWDDDKDILAASIDNPEFFASQIIRLYQDEKLWNKLRSNALSRIDTECSEQQFRDDLQQILTQTTSQ